jgi:hypothetical protein
MSKKFQRREEKNILRGVLNELYHVCPCRMHVAQAISALDASFNPILMHDAHMVELLTNSLVEFDETIRNALTVAGSHDRTILRSLLSIESAPFSYAKKTLKQVKLNELPKDDERRLAIQALFLYALKVHIAEKYPDTASFLQAYPNFAKHGAVELEKLRVNANWMNLVFHTIAPRGNKTFLVYLIPRISEGRGTKCEYLPRNTSISCSLAVLCS